VEKIVQKLRQISSDPTEAKRYWQNFHARKNQRISTHLVAHGALLAISIRAVNLKEIATQTWLFSAVIPVHAIRKFNASDGNPA
jgi:hypothetical protein